MPRDKTESQSLAEVPVVATPTTETVPFEPATYALVGLDPNAEDVHIAEMNREYNVAELAKRLDVLEYLHQRGNPLVVKTR